MSDNRKVTISVDDLLKQPDGEKILIESMAQQARSGELGSTWKPAPPEGLSARERARWWAQNPEMFLVALFNGDISEHVMQEIEQVAKDNDLAHKKIIDAKEASGLINAERSRLFEMLTDGGSWESQRKGSPSKAISDLRIAFDLRDITEPQIRSQKLCEAITQESGTMVESDAIRKRIKRIELLWQSVCHFNHYLIASFLEDPSEYEDMPAEKIPQMLSLLRNYLELRNALPESNTPPI